MIKKVLLAMSGGVDSSVAALLLKKKGYEVYGYFMNACPSGKGIWPSSIEWKKEEKMVRKICKIVGVKKLFVVDCEEGYENKIIKPMFESYKKGLTPNPDILCNNVGKFPGLAKKAEEIGADFIATGHYARVVKGKAGYELFMGKDKKKDQSYFLVGLGQEILSKVIFPIGDLTKEEVRKIARKNKFPNWDKHGSRGICYLGKIDLKSFLKERIEERKGKVLSPEGEVVGKHKGNFFFTVGERIGERKGFEIENDYRKKIGGKKLYVAEKQKGNILVVASEGHGCLKKKIIFIKGMKFVCEEVEGKMKARIRHLGELNSGVLSKKKSKWKFEFEEGIEGIAEGQFAVFYKGEKLIGGGEIRLS